MYKGVGLIEYEPLDVRRFENMQWSSTVPSNYLAEVHSFIYKHFDKSTVFEYNIITLLSLILENVHDHGSGSCIVTIGVNSSGHIIEIHEPNGGFDLKRLPNGTGGCGYREIKRSKCLISHSNDGKKTFVIISNKKV